MLDDSAAGAGDNGEVVIMVGVGLDVDEDSGKDVDEEAAGVESVDNVEMRDTDCVDGDDGGGVLGSQVGL
jgi:hypothetical protein